MTREEQDEKKYQEWWIKDGYHLCNGEFWETMKHVWLASRRLLREEQAEDRRYAQI